MRRFLKVTLLSALVVVFLLLAVFFVGAPPKTEEIVWGVNFSQKHARDLELNWQDTYLAILDDLGVKNIKLLTHWDQLEPKQNQYYFDDLNWQLQEAEKRGVKVILVIGMKTGRWPECHLPGWAQELSREEQQKQILELVENIVLRYRGRASVTSWQAENEPFFPFGNCPWSEENFVREEIALIKSLDTKNRPVIVSETGEFSFWTRAARFGDVVGTTMYRRLWSKELKMYVNFPLPPAFYWAKAKFIEKVFGKKVIVVELQAEPWGPRLLYDSSLQEQEKTMNLEQFRKNIEFAKRTGLDEFYLWGAEWWHWMKDKQSQTEIWEEAKNLFNENAL